jgi:hypothetical protein
MLTKSESIKNLALALSKAQEEMPPVLMDSVNPFYKSKYASLGAVIQGSRAVLAKNGLSISQFPTSQDGAIGVTTILMHVSGEWLTDSMLIETADNAKNPAQEAGITISYLRRYSWAAILGLYTEEDTDGEGVSEKTQKPAAKLPERGKWNKAQMDAVMETHYFSNVFEATNALALSQTLTPGATPIPGLLFWVTEYKKFRVEDKLLPAQAAEKADDAYTAEKNRKAQDKAVEP